MQMIGEEKNINNMQMQQINDWQKDNRNELRKPAYKPLATAHTHTRYDPDPSRIISVDAGQAGTMTIQLRWRGPPDDGGLSARLK